MNLTVLQESLKAGLAIVGRAVASKSSLPVLANVLLEAKGGRLTLAATNLEIGITHALGAQVDADGAITLPHKLLSDVINGLPNDRVTLTLHDLTRTVKVQCGRFTSNIKGIDAEEFPTIPSVETAGATLPADTLRQAIALTSFAAAADDSRPVLAGVWMRLDSHTLTLAAADGFRLALSTTPLPEYAGDVLDCIIPARVLDALGAILSGDSVSIGLAPGGTQIGFSAGNTVLVSRLIEGRFPDVERIVPQQHTTRLVVDKAELSRAVKAARLFSAHSQNVLRLDSAASSLTLSAKAAEVGDSTTELEAAVEGPEVLIALNAAYLADVVAALPTEQIAIELQTSQSPAVLKPVGSDGYVHVIMPMSVKE